METRVNQVMEKHGKGYNCAQAVACTYCDQFEISEKEAFRSMEGFGLGMGRMGTCGAVSAMGYLVGLKISDGDLENPKTKKQCYDTLKNMTQEFIDKNQSVECRELKGVDTGKPLRSCKGCMEDIAEIVESGLFTASE